LLPEEFPPETSVDIFSPDEIARKREDELLETHSTMAARKETEVNEGGLVDSNSP
jgi:hypothetical protein